MAIRESPYIKSCRSENLTQGHVRLYQKSCEPVVLPPRFKLQQLETNLSPVLLTAGTHQKWLLIKRCCQVTRMKIHRVVEFPPYWTLPAALLTATPSYWQSAIPVIKWAETSSPQSTSPHTVQSGHWGRVTLEPLQNETGSWPTSLSRFTKHRHPNKRLHSPTCCPKEIPVFTSDSESGKPQNKTKQNKKPESYLSTSHVPGKMFHFLLSDCAQVFPLGSSYLTPNFRTLKSESAGRYWPKPILWSQDPYI